MRKGIGKGMNTMKKRRNAMVMKRMMEIGKQSNWDGDFVLPGCNDFAISTALSFLSTLTYAQP